MEDSKVVLEDGLLQPISEYDTILNAGVQGMTADREDKLDVQEAQKLYSEAWLYKGWDLYAIGREDEALQCVKQHLALRKPGVKEPKSRSKKGRQK